MRTRTIVGALGLALVLVLLPSTLAGADFRGTDMWSNLTPSGGSGGGFADKYPISYYALDYHVDGPSVGLGGVSTGDIPALVAQFLAAFLFMVATFFMRLAISAFDWAFNVDIIGGSHGAIGPVGRATEQLWSSTFLPLIPTGVLCLAAWFLYKAMSRKFGEAGAGAMRAVALTVVALVIIFNPAATIGKASSLTNDLAGAIASGTTGGNGGQSVSDRMFKTFVYQPWAVLEFGGLKRCVSKEVDSEGYPKYVNGESSDNVCRSTTARYAPHFLADGPGSEDRKNVYEDIRDGKLPYDKGDAPAVDMMQAGGALQRLVFAVIFCVGIGSAILLLGLIAIAALFAQLALLVLLAATPVMVLLAIFPKTNDIVFTWAKWIGKFLVAKIVYAVMLSAALGVSAALMAFGGSSQFGYLFAFGAQAALFLGLFIKRKALAEQLTSRRDYQKGEHGARTFVAGAATAAVGVAAAPKAAAAAAASKGKERLETVSQQHAAKPTTAEPSAKREPGTPRPDTSSPPASAGREYSPATDAQGRDQVGSRQLSTTVATMAPDKHTDTQERGVESMPKTFREDLAQAKAERVEDKTPVPRPAPQPEPAPLRTGATASSFRSALEQERAKTVNT